MEPSNKKTEEKPTEPTQEVQPAEKAVEQKEENKNKQPKKEGKQKKQHAQKKQAKQPVEIDEAEKQRREEQKQKKKQKFLAEKAEKQRLEAEKRKATGEPEPDAPEEGGEKLSKNQQKRREKQKFLAEKAAEKAAEKLKQKKKDHQEGEQVQQKQQQILDPTAYYENRSKMITNLKSNPQTYPYPHKFDVKMNITDFTNKYIDQTKNNQFLPDVVSVAGRINIIRSYGKKLVFYDIHGDGRKLQVMCSIATHKGKQSFYDTHKIFRRGDIIGITGSPGRTKTGEFSIGAHEVFLLSPCLHMIPESHVGFSDPQSRFRKRYLDLIMNNRTRETFIARSKVIKFVRTYLDKLGFIEVETPMMNMIPGGATARPFTTFHNDLAMKLYMRIAPELFLKQLVVGGMDRVFEIGKNFRNQSIDQTHNPQYTSCEFYMAYADFNDLLELTEDMLSKMVLQLTGSYILKFHPEPENQQKVLNIDFTPPWRRISMLEQLQKCLGEPLPKDMTTHQANAFYEGQCKKHKVACSNPRTTIRLIDKLVGHFLEKQCLNPTFIMEHPQEMSPLAKYHRAKPGLTERFELFINYHEFCNAYTELNDPFVQKDLFMQQVKEKEKGDDESMFYDDVFVNALEHGLPPTAGWGLGIDRTVMLITDHIRIQEVLLFPAMKPIDQVKAQEKKQQKKVEEAPTPVSQPVTTETDKVEAAKQN